jgi:hypothetical protein
MRQTDWLCTAFSRSQLVVCLTQVYKLTSKLSQLQIALTDKLQQQVSIQTKFGVRILYFAGEHTAEVSSLAPYFVKFWRHYLQSGENRKKLKIYLQTWLDLEVTYLFQYRYSEIFIYSINPFQSNFSTNRIIPSSYLFWAVKRLVDYL